MAKQVIWSLVAKKQLKETFQILKLKNGNNEVSEVLYVQLQNILHRISMNPFIGQQRNPFDRVCIFHTTKGHDFEP